MVREVEIPGAAHRLLPADVGFLDPQQAVFDSMLKGWEIQQQSRMLARDTIESRLALIRRLFHFTNTYPWQWQPADAEQFTAHLRSGSKPIRHSTARTYQNSIGLFCDYLTDGRYGWAAVCEDRFGEAPVQICHEWNTVEHTSEFEGDPSRRAATYEEMQAIVDAADSRAERIKRSRRKGLLAALRDSAMIKTTYAFGLRRREVCMLDLHDLRRNPKVPTFGRFGALFVRWGKATAGGPPRRRTVLLVPEFDWVIDPLQFWLDTARCTDPPGWVRGRRVSLL